MLFRKPGVFQFRILKEAITAALFGPYTSKFPAEMPVIPDGFHGKPEFNKDECVGCKACFEVCPARAIEVVDDKLKKSRKLTHRQDVCIFCGQCEAACITEKGIKLTKEYILATLDRKQAFQSIEKELVVCEGCGETIGCLDHLKFLAKKVGHLLYTNPTLLMARHAELKLLEKDLPTDSPHKRAGHLKVLCPNCRREMILKEQW
ncbi:4Fe-4S binding protein [Candidatus Margulisiibacteriota bacterium]